jgi:hypothetical protein
MASGVASKIVELDPSNKLASKYLQTKQHQQPPGMPTTTRSPRVNTQMPGTQASGNFQNLRMTDDSSSLEKSLEEGYTSLKSQAKLLQVEFEAMYTINGLPTLKDEKIISNLKAISDGHISSVVGVVQPLSVREVAREIIAVPGKCQELIFEDFEAIVHWAEHQYPPLSPHLVRERLVKRKTLLDAALPKSMAQASAAVLGRIELEYLQKKYANSETMLGDRIEDIPKRNFFVSEDNYAWDMDELAQAITASDGVMRNPMTKQLFSESDIRMILGHPLGQRLKPMRLKQDQMKKGIRPATIGWIGKLGRIMLADQSLDTAPSRQAMDEFQAYVATLPGPEQVTIDQLKIPARDGFSKQPFDYTIGESVRDAIANTTCLHKVNEYPDN